MYIYFDTNGTIKEIVNDKSIRQGSTEANKIYCYIEGNPTIDDIWYMQKLPSGETSNEVSFKNSTVTKAIPYDAKRDMRYFKDFEQYTFYVFTLNAFLVSQKGLNLATIRIVVDNEIFALGELTFNVQENVINVDNGITISQYDYLLLAYASRTLNEVTANDLDALLDDKINAKIGDLANGSPKVFDTEANIEAMHDDEGIAVATDTGYIYVWNDTQEQYISTGMKYIADVSLFYTKTESDNTFAPKDTTFSSVRNLEKNYTTGKNIFNKNTVTNGYYIAYSNGQKIANASMAYSEYIFVEPNTSYTINKTYVHIAFYTINKEYISGVTSNATSPYTFTTTNETMYIIVSTSITNLNTTMLNVGTSILQYEDYYKITGDDVKINGANMFNGVLAKSMANGDFLNTIKRSDMALKYTNNLFNYKATTSGYYVAYNTGQILANASMAYSEYIPVNSSTTYWINKTYTHVAFFNAKFEYVSGVVSSGTVPYSFTTTATTKYIIVSTAITNLATTMLNDGVNALTFEKFGVVLDKNVIIEERGTTVVVDKNGGGDYTSFVACINAITPTKENPITVIVKEGTYNLREEDSSYQEDYAGYLGLLMPSYVNVIGFGNGDNVILSVECDTEQTYISTLTLTGTCSFKNITIKGNKTRYTIHDDYFVSEAYEHIFENVRFVGANLHYHHCYGAGMRKEGGYYSFKNCTFDCDENAFSVHNSSQAEGDQQMHEVYFQNCRFNNPTNYYSVVAHSITNCSNGFVSNIYMYGNKCNGKLGLDETTPTSTYGEGICWKITGYFTSYSSKVITNTDAVDYSSYIDIFNND